MWQEGLLAESEIMMIPDLNALELACADGLDNDGDGHTGYPDDPGCAGLNSIIEKPECDDGLDNDSDGFNDYPDDPGCPVQFGHFEESACDDGIDNDGDDLTDWDGGGGGDPDPNCSGNPYGNSEAPITGITVELAVLIPLLLWARSRRVRG